MTKEEKLEAFVFEAIMSATGDGIAGAEAAEKMVERADDLLEQVSDLKINQVLLVTSMMLENVILVMHKVLLNDPDPEIGDVSFREMAEATVSVITTIVAERAEDDAAMALAESSAEHVKH